MAIYFHFILFTDHEAGQLARLNFSPVRHQTNQNEHLIQNGHLNEVMDALEVLGFSVINVCCYSNTLQGLVLVTL